MPDWIGFHVFLNVAKIGGGRGGDLKRQEKYQGTRNVGVKKEVFYANWNEQRSGTGRRPEFGGDNRE